MKLYSSLLCPKPRPVHSLSKKKNELSGFQGLHSPLIGQAVNARARSPELREQSKMTTFTSNTPRFIAQDNFLLKSSDKCMPTTSPLCLWWHAQSGSQFTLKLPSPCWNAHCLHFLVAHVLLGETHSNQSITVSGESASNS